MNSKTPLPTAPAGARPSGYSWLAAEFQVTALPRHLEIYVARTHTRSEQTIDGYTCRVLPAPQWPGDDAYAHLRFALRYEGLAFSILRAVLPRLDPIDLARQIGQEPTSIYSRRIWYLYESITGKSLPLPDLTIGNYVPLADPERYYTGPVRRSSRHRVALNLLGDLSFCFVIRRTPALTEGASRHYDLACQALIEAVPPEIFERVLDFLYQRETRSSFEIERETPDQKRAAHFVRLLQEAAHQDYLQRQPLISLQAAIVDPRFAHRLGWRNTLVPPEQNFVSGRNAPNLEGIHYIPPRPQEIEALMQGWMEASRIALSTPELPPVVAAAAIAWSFVFLHPFSDGNGRIHRFLIHHILARLGFAPHGVIFPVSAVMLSQPRAYDASLEAFSTPLLPLLEWTMDEDQRLHVQGDTSDFYRFIDYTPMAEALYRFVQQTIERDLPQELRFLRGYDAARFAMRDIAELPGPVADRFIQFCRQNGWRLSAAKRNSRGLEKLTDAEIDGLEEAVRNAFEPPES